MDGELKSPNFKSALSFFNNLDQKSTHSSASSISKTVSVISVKSNPKTIISAKNKSSCQKFEVENLIMGKHVETTNNHLQNKTNNNLGNKKTHVENDLSADKYDEVKQIIPRAKLNKNVDLKDESHKNFSSNEQFLTSVKEGDHILPRVGAISNVKEIRTKVVINKVVSTKVQTCDAQVLAKLVKKVDKHKKNESKTVNPNRNIPLANDILKKSNIEKQHKENDKTNDEHNTKVRIKPKTLKKPPNLKIVPDLLQDTDSSLTNKLIDDYQSPQDMLTKHEDKKETLDGLLTPDIEAKQIFENFKKEISPYNTFEIPIHALDSDFFKQTLTFVNDANDRANKQVSRRASDTASIRVRKKQSTRSFKEGKGANYQRPCTGSNSKSRSDAFLEPYLQGLGTRHSPPGTNAPCTPSPPPNNNVAHRTSLSNTAHAMAPNSRPLSSSRSVSRESLISSHAGGCSEASSEGSEEEGYGVTCDIGLMERLVLTHPIWFLPGIQRAGAFHLLQGKEEGCFVVRKSSQSDTMALSVRLPPDKGPYIEHYLIHSSEGRLGLETSENRFVDMAALIAHYSTCCDELPVQLTLPRQIRESKSRQQLSSLALLGQEFWSYSPPPSTASSPNADLVLSLNPLMSTFKQGSEASTPVGSQGSNKPARPNTLNLLNKNDPNRVELMKSMTSLKGGEVSRTPPPPPPRWSKPTTPQQPPPNNFTVTTTVTFSVNSQSPNNEKPPSQLELVSCDPKRMSPEGQCNTSTISSKGSLTRRHPVTSPPSSVLSPTSVMSPCSDSILSPDMLSPLSVSKQGSRSSKRKQKVSKHYQESDIVDSPTMLYYKSGLGDKISDYEDVWTNEGQLIKQPLIKHNNNNENGNLASPDLLQHTLGNDVSRNGSDITKHITSLNNNVLSPTDSSHNSTTTKSFFSTSVQNGSTKVPPIVPSPLPFDSSHSFSTGNLDSPGVQPLPKQASPFYAEPADSLSNNSINQVPRRLVTRPAPGVPVHHRHSNPPGLGSGKVLSPGLERTEDFSDFNGAMISSSVDNLSPKQKFLGLRKPEVKPVLPPFVKPKNNFCDSWQVDNSWRFVTNECDISMDSSETDYDSDWPNVPNLLTSLETFTPDTDTERPTLQDLISRRFPDIRTSDLTSDNAIRHRMSAYDNVEDRLIIPKAPPSEISEMTDFSEPWAEVCQGTTETETETYSEHTLTPSVTPTCMKVASIKKSRSFRDRLDPLLAAPRVEALRTTETEAIGMAIRKYALELAQDKSTTFAQNIDNFIACTCESKETNPQIVMRNMRQFMSGMKNYLVKHGEKEFYREIERERNKLKSTEFLNLDAILEGVMHKLVVKPLKNHIQKLFLEHYEKTGAIRLLADNIQYAATRPISELAIKPSINLPSEAVLNRIQQYLHRLQQSHSPLEKLEYLLAATALIFNSAKSSHTGSGKCFNLGADDFLPIFVWILVKTNFVAAEIEAEYMWGLLHPSLLSGEGGYYLTTLSSAVHVLKNFKESGEENCKNQVKNESVLKVVVPDELHGSILTKTLPARPHMSTKEVCKIIAHKARITNPQDYALYRLTDGEETMLLDNECPQDFVQNKEGKHTMLAYKRIDAKIAWPPQDKLNI